MQNNHVTVFYRHTSERKLFGPMIEAVCSRLDLEYTYIKRTGELDENNMLYDRRFIILGHNQEKPVASKLFSAIKRAKRKLIICSLNNLPEKLDFYQKYDTGIIFTDGQSDDEIKKQIAEAFDPSYEATPYLNPEARRIKYIYEKIKGIISRDIKVNDINALLRSIYMKSLNISVENNKSGNSQGFLYLMNHSGKKSCYKITQRRARIDMQMLGSVIVHVDREYTAAQKEYDRRFSQ